MKQNQVALHLEGRDVGELMSLAQVFASGLKGNAHFVGIVPGDVALTVKREELEAQLAKVAGARAALEGEEIRERQIKEEMITLMVLVTNAAENMVEGNRDKLITGGFPLRNLNRAPVIPAHPPAKVRGVPGQHSGEIDWKWKSAGRNMTYIAEVADSFDGPYTQVYVGTRCKFTSKGHVPGQLKYMRVRVQKAGSSTDFCVPTRVMAH